MRLGAATLAMLALPACAEKPATTQGKDISTLYNIVLVIATVIALGVIGMILLACVRYRKQPGDDTLPPQTHGNTTFEIIWTLVPTIIVLALFAMSFVAIRAIDKKANASDYGAIVEVRGFQWAWTFDYGNNPAGTHVLVKTLSNDDPPQLIVPVGEKIHIEERSDNVIHSFFIPAFLFKRDVVPGRANGFDFTVEAPGVYKGQCAELCGTEHAKMTFTVKAVGRAEFDQWFTTFKPPRPKCDETGQATTKPTISSVPGQAQWVNVCAYVTAGQPLTFTLQHGGGQPHNLAIVDGDTLDPKKVIAATKIIQSGSASVNVPALKAGGDYSYFCQVHPTMEGRIVVQ
jgi:cytochrome c oxidase subunit 2